MAYIASGPALIENCTFSDNNPHAIHNDGDTVDVVNSILYFSNNGNSGGAQVTGKLNITYSDVQNGYTGTGNINFNPLFLGNGVYKIVSPSPCIDAGDPAQQYNDACFPPSLSNSRNDMGAHGGPQACGWNVMGLVECGPVPVTWLYYKGRLQDKDAELTWATALEQNTKNFIIERSLDGTQL